MQFRSLPLSIQLDESVSSTKVVPADVQIMRVGTFFSDENGKLNITTDMLQNMVKNFTDRVRGVDLAIDYKHDADDVAAGWIKQLYLLNDNKELWATVDWTPKGNKILADKEFRYLSADFHLDFQHNESKKKHGPTLFGAGLTNRPFIKEMDPVIELSETKGIKMEEKDQMIADLQSQIEALKKQISDDAAKDVAEEPKPELASAEPAKPELADVAKENEDLKLKVAAYEASAKKLEEEKKLAEQKSSFDKLFAEGRAVEAQRVHFMSGDTVKFAECAVKVNLQGSGSTVEAPVNVAPANRDEAILEVIKLSEKLVTDKKAKSIGEAQQLVLNENPELRKKIYG